MSNCPPRLKLQRSWAQGIWLTHSRAPATRLTGSFPENRRSGFVPLPIREVSRISWVTTCIQIASSDCNRFVARSPHISFDASSWTECFSAGRVGKPGSEQSHHVQAFSPAEVTTPLLLIAQVLGAVCPFVSRNPDVQDGPVSLSLLHSSSPEGQSVNLTRLPAPLLLPRGYRLRQVLLAGFDGRHEGHGAQGELIGRDNVRLVSECRAVFVLA